MTDTQQLLQDILRVLRNLDEKAKPVREILSIPQAAEYLGQSEHTLREWVRLRRIPFYKVNGTIKFRRSRLDKWINRTEVPMIE